MTKKDVCNLRMGLQTRTSPQCLVLGLTHCISLSEQKQILVPLRKVPKLCPIYYIYSFWISCF